MAALDRAIDRFLDIPTVTTRTVEAYEGYWRRWSAFCEARGFEALGAPIGAFHALLGAAACGTLRRAGKSPKQVVTTQPFSPSVVDGWLAAIRYHHSQEQQIAAYDHPDHRDAFRQVRAGYRRWAGVHAVQAAPLDVASARRLLPLRLPLNRTDCGRRAAVLLAIDEGLSADQLSWVRPEDVVDRPGGAVIVFVKPAGEAVGGTSSSLAIHVACRHPGDDDLPTDCCACLLRSARDSSSDQSLLFGSVGDVGVTPRASEVRHELSVRFTRLARQWTHVHVVGGRLTVTGDSEERTATRHAVALVQQPGALAHLRSRAFVLLSWHLGLRSCDARWLLREDIHSAAGSIVGRVRRSKTPVERGGRTFGLTRSAELQLCAVAAVAEWLAVRDCAAGAAVDGQSLFCAFSNEVHPLPRVAIATYAACWLMWHDLQTRAGGPHEFSPHSTRTGYAVLAASQGASATAMQATMGLAKPDRAAAYARARREGAAGAPQRKLAARVDAANLR